MSSRQEKPQPLSDLDVQRIGEEVAAGAQPMVWFTSAAIGVEEGRSGKIITLGNPAEGDFLHVRPTGSKDVLSFSPTEVTLTKPPLKRAVSTDKPAATAKPAAVRPATAGPAPGEPHGAPLEPAVSAAAKPVSPGPAAPTTPERSAKAPIGARKAKLAEATVTVTGSADGEWVVDVVCGKTRTVRALSVPGSAVAQAAKALHPEVAEAIESVLEAARGAQRVKVEQLQAELERARRMLDELSE